MDCRAYFICFCGVPWRKSKRQPGCPALGTFDRLFGAYSRHHLPLPAKFRPEVYPLPQMRIPAQCLGTVLPPVRLCFSVRHSAGPPMRACMPKRRKRSWLPALQWSGSRLFCQSAGFSYSSAARSGIDPGFLGLRQNSFNGNGISRTSVAGGHRKTQVDAFIGKT